MVLLLIGLSSFATAVAVPGTVTNGTTGKPVAGAEAVLLLPSAQGMKESSRATSDAQGHFSLTVPDAGGSYLVRITHQKVNYVVKPTAGSQSIEVQVFDAAKQLKGVSTTVEMLRIGADKSILEVLELYTVNNKSTPRRTLTGDHTFEFVLPEGAQIVESAAEAPGEDGVEAAVLPVRGKKNHYSFAFPIRPGETYFQVVYHLPYSGQIALKPTLLTPLQHFVAVVPKSMQFRPDNPQLFQSMPDDQGSNTEVVTSPKPGDSLGFILTGTGWLQDVNQQAQSSQGEASGSGGGLVPPAEASNPLNHYRGYLLAAFAAILVLGVLYTANHDHATEIVGEGPELGDAEIEPEPAEQIEPGPARHSPANMRAKGPANHSPLLLKAMKEELFQLEVDRQQQKISVFEYEKAKSALEETIRRALSRTTGEVSRKGAKREE